MDEQLRLQRLQQIERDRAHFQVLMLEQAIAMDILSGGTKTAKKAQAGLPKDHQWVAQLPTEDEVKAWTIEQGQAAVARERAKWPDERIRQFAKEVKDAQNK